MLPTHISTITKTVASNQKIELAQVRKIERSTEASKQYVETCTFIKSEISKLVSSTKISFDSIISRAKLNIQEFEKSHQKAINKLHTQEENT